MTNTEPPETPDLTSRERHKARKKRNRERNKRRLAKKRLEKAELDAEIWKNRRTRR